MRKVERRKLSVNVFGNSLLKCRDRQSLSENSAGGFHPPLRFGLLIVGDKPRRYIVAH